MSMVVEPRIASAAGLDMRSHGIGRPSSGELARHSFFAFLGFLGGAILQFGYNLGLARLYGPESVGLFAFGLGLASVGSVIGGLGAKETILRYSAAYIEAGNRGALKGLLTFGLVLATLGTLVIGLVLFLLAEPIAQWTSKPASAQVLRYMAGSIPLLAGIVLTAAVMQGARRLDLSAALGDIGRSLAPILALGAAALLAQPFTAFLSWYLLTLMIILPLGLLIAARVLPLRGGSSMAWNTRAWLGFSLVVTILDLFRSTTGWADTIILGFLVPATEVGVYFVALRTAQLVTLSLAAFNAILSPLAAALWHAADRENLGRVYRTATRWTCATVLPSVVAAALLRDELIGLFGDQFVERSGGVLLLVFLVGRAANGLTGGVGRMLVMTGNHRLELVDTVIGLAITIGGVIWLVPKFGLMAAAGVNAGTVVLMNGVKLIQVRVLLGLHPYDSSYLKLVLATGVAFLAGTTAYELSNAWSDILRCAVTLPAIGVVYAATLAGLGLDEDDHAVLQALKRRLSGVQ